jgi:hypothetical protein
MSEKPASAENSANLSVAAPASDNAGEGESLAQRSKKRQEAKRDAAALASFRSFAIASPEAARTLRNAQMETNPRLAWAMTMAFPGSGDDKGPAGKALGELRAVAHEKTRRYDRDKLWEADSLVEFTLRVADRPLLRTRERIEGLKDETGALKASASREFGARAILRLSTRAFNRALREIEADPFKRLTLGERERTALRNMAPLALRNRLFTDSDCLATLAPVVSLGGAARRQWIEGASTANPSGWDEPGALPRLFLAKEALAGRRPEIAKKLLASLAGTNAPHEDANWGVSAGRESLHQAHRLGWSRESAVAGVVRWNASGQFEQGLNGKVETLDASTPVVAGVFSLSLAQGAGWEWIRDAGVTPEWLDALWIGSHAKAEDAEAIVGWIARTHAAASEREERIKKKRSTPRDETIKNGDWLSPEAILKKLETAPNWPPQKALTLAEIASLAPFFGAEEADWRSIVKNELSHGRMKRAGAAAKGEPSRLAEIERRRFASWREGLGEEEGRLAEQARQAAESGRAGLQADMESVAGRIKKVRVAAEAAMDARRDATLCDPDAICRAAEEKGPGASARRGGGASSAKELIEEIVARAWLAQWGDPAKAWDGFEPADASHFEESEKLAYWERSMTARLLFGVIDGALIAEPNAERDAALGRAISQAGKLDFWQETGRPESERAPGRGPLRRALADGRKELALAMIEVGAGPKASTPGLVPVSRHHISPSGHVSLDSDASNRRVVTLAKAGELTDGPVATLGIAALALLRRDPELALAAQKATRSGFERDLAQLKMWANSTTKCAASDTIEEALALGEARLIATIGEKGQKKTAQKNARRKNPAPAPVVKKMRL